MQVLAFGRYQVGRSMPTLMHLPTKVPRDLQCKPDDDQLYKSTQAWNLSSVTGTAGGSRCSAGRRLPARITTSPIRPAMAVARPTLTHHCRRYPWAGLGGGQASLIPWQGAWDRKFERRSRLGGVAGSSIPALMNWPTKIASGICSTSQMIISVEAMSTNVARELRFGGVHRNVRP